MVRFIATDMDGTLVNDEGVIDEKVFEMITYLNSKEIMFAAASGRFYSQLNSNFDKVRGEMILIAHNGALVKYNKDGDVLFESDIAKEDIRKVTNLKFDFGERIFLAGAKNAYLVNPEEAFVKGFKAFGIPVVIVESFDQIVEPIYKISYFMLDGVTDEFKKAVDDSIPRELESVISGANWLDIMNIGISKGRAIKMLQDKLNFNEEETMVFGDYYNDLSMFKVAKYSYAMEGAPEEVKDKANYIAGSNSENGVYNSINQYLQSI